MSETLEDAHAGVTSELLQLVTFQIQEEECCYSDSKDVIEVVLIVILKSR